MRRFTFSRRIPRLHFSSKWRLRGDCCTATGLCTIRRMQFSVQSTCHLRNWSRVTRGSTSGSSPTLRFGDVGPKIGARLHRTWRCRICTREAGPRGRGQGKAAGCARGSLNKFYGGASLRYFVGLPLHDEGCLVITVKPAPTHGQFHFPAIERSLKISS